jgi:hypothetical protein
MFPILLGKIKELEDKIKNLTPVDPYDPKTNTIILQPTGDTDGPLNMKWKDINKLFKDGKQIYVNPKNWLNVPDNADSLWICTAVYQYANNSFIVWFNNSLNFSANSENDYPSKM